MAYEDLETDLRTDPEETIGFMEGCKMILALLAVGAFTWAFCTLIGL